MEQKNLIVPLAWRFRWPKASPSCRTNTFEITGLSSYLFYLSNVEDYIQNVMPAFQRNIASFATGLFEYVHSRVAQFQLVPTMADVHHAGNSRNSAQVISYAFLNNAGRVSFGQNVADGILE
jgi:hypothetical protein